MMNLSQLLTSIKMDLGIYGLTLPFENENQVLHDVIKLKTIKTFSAFAPHVIKIDLMISELETVQSSYDESIYVIPDMFGDRTVIGVRKVEPRDKFIGTGLVDPTMYGGIDIFNDLAMGAAYANLQSYAVPSMTYRFEAPNILRIRNLMSLATEINVEFQIEHAENLSTIKPTLMQSFSELAELDIKRFLYNAMKHYTDVQTAYGSISMKIDDWANAEADRTALLDRWKDIYHIDYIDPIHFI